MNCNGLAQFWEQLCRPWSEIEAHKWRDLELDLSKTARKAIKFGSVGTSWSVKNAHFALFITDYYLQMRTLFSRV